RSDDARAFAVKATLKPQKYQLPQDNGELIEEVSQLRSTYNGKGTQDLMAAVKRMHKIDAEEAVILDGIRRLIKGVLLSALNELKAPLTDGDSSSDLSCESDNEPTPIAEGSKPQLGLVPEQARVIPDTGS